MKIRRFTYTKDNGDVSDRIAIIVSSPRKNYLVYDVTNFTDNEIRLLQDAIEEADEYRSDCISEFEAITGKQLNRLWRSFKPGGIEWTEGNEI